ncbi:glutamine cyclotransferase, WD40/YVTN repeat-like-containing domain protein [Artemisia annua]|uniref:Glutamine cyclotransferase, WD40/YVTN repeat-like-containing domain protein n=1 Tax=Artemisia annua TaxID=35608 RepID=A0A2U1QB64_ARTAN|nr:glutamine cyclotransferase, WD40/YVTN repeat-like-containing domain protein [Artemisia annua]
MTMAQTSFADDDRVYSIQVVNEFSHDPSAFTQFWPSLSESSFDYALTEGLLYEGNNTLFESTGLNGHSSVRKVNLQTAEIEALHKMNDSEFGEGLTLLGDRLYQLTWMQKTGFIYDKHNLSKFETFSHNMDDGWGFATDGKVLFGSDGSSSLYQIDPQTMKVIAEKVIRFNDHEVHNLNELEYINNEVWANIWLSDCIVRISPTDGNVTGWIVLPELRLADQIFYIFSFFRKGLIEAGYNIDVLNGIAWDADNKRIFG